MTWPVKSTIFQCDWQTIGENWSFKKTALPKTFLWECGFYRCTTCTSDTNPSKRVNHTIKHVPTPSPTAVLYGRGRGGRTCWRSEAEGYLGDVWAHRWWTAGPWLGWTTAERWSARTERPWDSGRTSTSGHRTTEGKTEPDADLKAQTMNRLKVAFCFSECM